MSTTRKTLHRRRGRPATPRPSIDTGTPELAAKRHCGLTEEVLDVFYKNGAITEQQRNSALHFRWLYRLRFGAPTPQAVDFTPHHRYTPPTEDCPDWKNRRNAEYRAIADILHQHGLLAIMLRVAVFNDQEVLEGKNAPILSRLFCDAALLLHTLQESQKHLVPH